MTQAFFNKLNADCNESRDQIERNVMDSPISHPFGAAILAAGASTRMGRPKMLLPWGPTTVLGHLISLWSQLGARQIAVVQAAGDGPIESELGRLEVPMENRIVNPDRNRGMFSSIQCAARWKGWDAGLDRWVLILGDQPHIGLDTLRRLLQSSDENPERIAQPTHQDRGRHPIIFPKRSFAKLAESGSESLKAFLAGWGEPLQRVEIRDAGLDLDIDYPADYERALRLWADG